MHTRQGQQELASYQRAAEGFISNPQDTEAMATMMRIACEARSGTLRQWAKEWLLRNVNVRVVEEAQDGGRNAAPPKAANLC